MYRDKKYHIYYKYKLIWVNIANISRRMSFKLWNLKLNKLHPVLYNTGLG